MKTGPTSITFPRTRDHLKLKALCIVMSKKHKRRITQGEAVQIIVHNRIVDEGIDVPQWNP